MSGVPAIFSQKQLMILGMYMINCKPPLTLINDALDKTQYIDKEDEIDLLKDVRKNVFSDISKDYVFNKTP